MTVSTAPLTRRAQPVRHAAAAALLLVLLAGCGGGASATGDPTLTGQALAGEAPVPDALVLALDITGRPAGEARTGSDGRFSLVLPPGTYSVTAEAGAGTLGLPAPEVVVVEAGADPAPVVLRYAMLREIPAELSE
ncbi:MAG TPA: carboxypeptidase-like regulatory domain-containing protein [Egibacteraceae bacterium]|nr:carboxypeptidase-like regulatory domain-containing protein [Egibacteraceae bacterium]